jgi:hypothetical protein
MGPVACPFILMSRDRRDTGLMTGVTFPVGIVFYPFIFTVTAAIILTPVQYLLTVKQNHFQFSGLNPFSNSTDYYTFYC